MPHPSTSTARPLRVVIADDSGFMRKMLADALAEQGFEVVASACNGDEALAVCTALRPDVLSLDLAMPGLDGIGVLRALRDRSSPIPVVVVSAFSPAHGARAVDALAEGAVELVAKPSAGNSPTNFFRELGDKVRAAAASRRSPRIAATAPAVVRTPAPPVAVAGGVRIRRTVVIACSTGGPRALAELLPMLPARLGDGVLIVQHMPAGFTSSLATRLDAASKLHVIEASGSERLDPGTALLAPGGSHLRLDALGHSRLSDEAEIGGLRPRADLTIADAAQAFGARTLLVVLTGMGKDGLEGARAVRAAGGRILVEAESTCTVYGMPRAISEAGLADAELPLPELAGAIEMEAGS
jgi:two-component system chemotaxis response regulator CheB